MRRESRARVLAACAMLPLGLALASSPCRAEPEFLANEGAGRLEIGTEKTLVVKGLEGEFSIEQGRAAEVLFRSTDPDDKSKLVPIATWMEGNTIFLRPTEGEPPRKRNVFVALPSGLDVRIEANDSKVSVAGLQGEVGIAGERLHVEAYSCRGRVDADVRGGWVRMDNLGDGATVRGSDVDLRLTNITGRVSLTLSGKVVGLRAVQSAIDGDLTGVDLTLEDSEGPVDLKLHHGSALVNGLRQGGTFDLTEAPLRYFESVGDTTVHADGDVQFKECKGTHRIEQYGGTLRWSGNEGAIDVTAEGTDMIFEHLSGPLKIHGRRSPLRLSEMTGDLTMESVSSDTTIDRASGHVTIDADGGDLKIDRSTAAVDVRNSGGDVRVLNHSGPATVRADGRTVEVSWLSLPAGQDSLVQNQGGDVTVRFLGGSGGHVSAEAPDGRVETDLPRISVEPGGTSASGFVGGSKQPNVVVRSSGNIELSGSAGDSDDETGR